MSFAMFDYPPHAAVNRPLPKSKIYAHAKPTRRIQNLFVDEVDQLVWKYKLSSETINLPASTGVQEIQIFGIQLRTEELSQEVLRTIDNAIPSPIFFELAFQGRLQLCAAYKRPSDADSSKSVVSSYFASDWCSDTAARQPLPPALNLGTLYEQMLRRLIPIPAQPGESLKSQVARVNELQRKQLELARLEQRLSREKQFNRKVELNRELRTCKQQIDSLMGTQE